MFKDQDEDESMKKTKKEQPNMYKKKSQKGKLTENLKMRKQPTESNAKKCRISYDLKSMLDKKMKTLSSGESCFFGMVETKMIKIN